MEEKKEWRPICFFSSSSEALDLRFSCTPVEIDKGAKRLDAFGMTVTKLLLLGMDTVWIFIHCRIGTLETVPVLKPVLQKRYKIFPKTCKCNEAVSQREKERFTVSETLNFLLSESLQCSDLSLFSHTLK